jgi:hypothetical protein
MARNGDWRGRSAYYAQTCRGSFYNQQRVNAIILTIAADDYKNSHLYVQKAGN